MTHPGPHSQTATKSGLGLVMTLQRLPHPVGLPASHRSTGRGSPRQWVVGTPWVSALESGDSRLERWGREESCLPGLGTPMTPSGLRGAGVCRRAGGGLAGSLRGTPLTSHPGGVSASLSVSVSVSISVLVLPNLSSPSLTPETTQQHPTPPLATFLGSGPTLPSRSHQSQSHKGRAPSSTQGGPWAPATTTRAMPATCPQPSRPSLCLFPAAAPVMERGRDRPQPYGATGKPLLTQDELQGASPSPAEVDSQPGIRSSPPASSAVPRQAVPLSQLGHSHLHALVPAMPLRDAPPPKPLFTSNQPSIACSPTVPFSRSKTVWAGP